MLLKMRPISESCVRVYVHVCICEMHACEKECSGQSQESRSGKWKHQLYSGLSYAEDMADQRDAYF